MNHFWKAALIFEDGTILPGRGFGSEIEHAAEGIFNTAMSGYQEVLTDPSYSEQIIVMTYPHIGNTGVNLEDNESKKIYAGGLVVRDYCHFPSNFRSVKTLHDWLCDHKVPAISNVDTRFITLKLRSEGAQKVALIPCSGLNEVQLRVRAKEVFNRTPAMEGLELVSKVSTEAPYYFKKPDPSLKTVVVYDFGAKRNILSMISQLNRNVFVVPYDYPHEEVLKLSPLWVMLSNGPGDPDKVPKSPDEIKALMGKVPIFAICMGHQLLARSLGCKTYKLKFGHHGVNQPIKDLILNKIFITSQNHGFAVKKEDLEQRNLMTTHVNLNDGTVEGFASQQDRFFSLQFHPEVKPGPLEGLSYFKFFEERFLQ